MLSLITFLKESANNLSQEKREQILSELAQALNVDISVPNEQIAEKLSDQAELIEMYVAEIGRLNRTIVSHQDGVDNVSTAALDVLGERARQRRTEGYDDSHDDNLKDWSLLSAAMAFIEDAHLRGTAGGKGYDDSAPVTWPFDEKTWKPKGIRKSLVIACALIIAEIEVLDRSLARFQEKKENTNKEI